MKVLHLHLLKAASDGNSELIFLSISCQMCLFLFKSPLRDSHVTCPFFYLTYSLSRCYILERVTCI